MILVGGLFNLFGNLLRLIICEVMEVMEYYLS